MGRALAFLLIGLVFGGGAGFVVGSGSATQQTVSAPTMDHSAHTHAHGEALTLASGEGAPTLALEVVPDPVAGWNLHLATTNFLFAAERAGADHVPGEGHAHIYVNGTKVARAYGDWFHLEKLPEGSVEIEVTLNANDHRALMIGDMPLSASVRFQNPG